MSEEIEDTQDFMDFDMMASQDVEDKPYPYKLFGVTGEIPPKLPFGVVIQYERNKARKDEEAGLSLTIDMLTAIFGEDTVDKWSKNPKFSADKMSEVLQWGLNKYGLGKTPKVNRGKLRVVKE